MKSTFKKGDKVRVLSCPEVIASDPQLVDKVGEVVEVLDARGTDAVRVKMDDRIGRLPHGSVLSFGNSELKKV